MKKVLICDQSEEFSAALSGILCKHYNVRTYRSGLDASLQIEYQRPDILIINLSLPYLDGFTILQKLKHRPPVILALTNLCTVEILEDAAALGIQDVILLPCTIFYVRDRLNALIQKEPSPSI